MIRKFAASTCYLIPISQMQYPGAFFSNRMRTSKINFSTLETFYFEENTLGLQTYRTPPPSLLRMYTSENVDPFGMLVSLVSSYQMLGQGLL